MRRSRVYLGAGADAREPHRCAARTHLQCATESGGVGGKKPAARQYSREYSRGGRANAPRTITAYRTMDNIAYEQHVEQYKHTQVEHQVYLRK